MEKKSLLDFQAHWKGLVDKAFADYGSLTPDERVWFNCQSLQDQVNNGGLISYYYNSGAEFNQETILDLQWLGFPELAGLLIRINGLFPGGQPSTDMDERNEIIDTWPAGKYDELMEELDEQFYEKEPELESVLIQHIETKLSLL